jgi:hypothetical protein
MAKLKRKSARRKTEALQVSPGRGAYKTAPEDAPSPLKPSASVLCKLASAAVHADEFFSAKGHLFDRNALLSVLADDELRAWLAAMTALGMAPVKR